MDETLNVAEYFCESTANIVRGFLEGISYDSTVLCTIIDDSKKADGVYTVQGSSAKFEAYSLNTNYRVNDNVYVQIPNGDWNEQKTILSKKVEKQSQQPLTYLAPFSQFVDITGNMIKGKVSDGLLANAPVGEDTEPASEIKIWEWIVDQEKELPLIDYTRLGIQAEFQSWLEEDTFFGNYGLKLKVWGYRKTESAAAEDNAKTEEEAVCYTLELNEKDMYGNPYNYPTYFTQEKMFDISEIYSIWKMELFFYEKPGSFYKSDGTTLIQCQDFLGNYMIPNLFVREPYVALGYDISEFEDEMLYLYTFNTENYISSQTPEDNTKQVHVRWIHKKEDGTFESVPFQNDLDYTLTFYRYELGRGSADDYSGVYWKVLSTHTHTYDENNKLTIENKYAETAGAVPADRSPGTFDTWFIPDVELQSEQIKAILTFNNKRYRSRILEFTNNKDVKNKAALEALEALTIRCMDNSYGNYYIYALGNKLLNEADASTTREFRAYFDLDYAKKNEADLSILTEAESVEWIIPKTNTMLVLEESQINSETDNETVDKENYHIKWIGSLKDKQQSDNGFAVSYRINSYFSQYKGDNTVQLRIVKEGVEYSTSKTLSFGPAGTSGIDHTLVLDFDRNINALTPGDNDAVFVTARLYNFQNQEIDISNRDIVWSWKGYTADVVNTTHVKYTEVEGQKNKVELSLTTNAKLDTANYSILQCTLKKWTNAEQNGWGDYDLIAYLPIPIRSSTDYRHIIGPTVIIYNSDGIADSFYRDAYALRKKDGTDYYGKWEIFSGRNSSNDDDSAFRPTITQAKTKNADGNDVTGYFLNPSNLYVEDACDQLCVCGYSGNTIIWSQPLLILQNRWPSAMLNSWDGQLKIDEENNAILTARIAAGRKENDNTFTGVIMGDWNDGQTENNKLVKHTGLAGYHYGAMSFAFVNDGTAFIGKQGRGRIQFDGNNGTITSGNYVKNQSGMLIDLDDAIIDAYDFQLKSKHVFIDSATTNGDDESNTRNVYFQIKDSDANNLIHISENSYYLQSSNFTSGTIDEPGEGMKIDLDDGRIDAYTFKLVSKNLIINSTTDATTFLTVRNNNGDILINAGTNNFYLQSDDYIDGTSGMRIDLENGRIRAYSFQLKATNLTIDSSGPTFYIGDGTDYIDFDGSRLKISATKNIKIGSGDNYIEIGGTTGSITIKATSGITLGTDGTSHIKIDEGKVDIKAQTFNLAAGDLILNSNPGTGEYYFKAGKDDNIISLDASGTLNIRSNNFYLKAGDLEINSSALGDAYIFKVGKDNNIISLTANGNLTLKATKNIELGSGDNLLKLTETALTINATAFKLIAGTAPNNLILDSSATTYPLQIGTSTTEGANCFKVKWDGTLEANNANLTGEINANSGRIGYWNIQTGTYGTNGAYSYSRLWAQATSAGNHVTSLYSEYPSSEKNYRFVISTNHDKNTGLVSGTIPFCINKDGSVEMTTVSLNGDLTLTVNSTIKSGDNYIQFTTDEWNGSLSQIKLYGYLRCPKGIYISGGTATGPDSTQEGDNGQKFSDFVTVNYLYDTSKYKPYAYFA